MPRGPRWRRQDPPRGRVTQLEQRADALRPGFRGTDRNLAEVAAICHAVDVLPLAIDLAASRIVLLTPKEIASHLSDRLRLLTGGLRDVPDRMRSLRATIDWSHEPPLPGERRVFRQLSVFVGGFDLGAPATVVELRGTDLMTAVGSLVEKSLLRVAIPAGCAGARYFLLETLRDYGLAQLAATGEEATVREPHATWYLELAGALAPRRELGAQSVPAAVERLDEEHGDLRADGLTNREIADALFISLRTVATHVVHILTKLNITSRTAAVAYAIRSGPV